MLKIFNITHSYLMSECATEESLKFYKSKIKVKITLEHFPTLSARIPFSESCMLHT